MQFSYESSVMDDDIMSEQSLSLAATNTTKPKKIVMGRSRPQLPPSGLTLGPAAGTASPFRGPGRFLTLAMDGQTAKGAQEVERQSQILMAKMRAGSVPARQATGPGSPRPQGKENRAGGRVQSSSPARRPPCSPLRQQVGPTVCIRPDLAGLQMARAMHSPVVAAAGLARPVLDSTVGTDLLERAAAGSPGRAPPFLTSTCHKLAIAKSRVTPARVMLSRLKTPLPGLPVGRLLLDTREQQPRVPDPFPPVERTDSAEGFLPTPPLYRNPPPRKPAAAVGAKKKRAEIDLGDPDKPEEEEAPRKAEQGRERPGTNRDSDADLGFGQPPPKEKPGGKAPGGRGKVQAATPKVAAKRAQAPAAAPTVAEEETTFNNFAKPSTKRAKAPQAAPAVVEEVTFNNFAKPSAPKARKKAPAAGQAPETTFLDLWMPRLKGNKLFIEGNKLDSATGAYFDERWTTSRIVSRTDEKTVATKKGSRYVLEGGLRVRDSEMVGSAPIPGFIIANFAAGFPENWEQLVSNWVTWVERQQQPAASTSLAGGIMFNSTRLLQTPSQTLRPGASNLSTMSSVTAVEASRFLPLAANRTGSCLACPNCNTFLLAPTAAAEQSGRLELATIQEERELPADRPSSLSQERAAPRKDSSDESPVKQVEHRSRSKNIRTNFNSATFLNSTMSKTEVTNLRVKDYPHISQVNKKNMYTCMFCDFTSNLFGSLKKHISSEHSQEEPGQAPPARKAGRRSQSAESALSPAPPASKQRRSLSASDEALPDCVEVRTDNKGKVSYFCQPCNFHSKQPTDFFIKRHLGTAKHAKRMELEKQPKGVKRKSTSSLSSSPSRKQNRQGEAGKGEKRKKQIAEQLVEDLSKNHKSKSPAPQPVRKQNPKKSPEKLKRSQEKLKKSQDKPDKSQDKAKKSMEKPEKAQEKPDKAQEKPKSQEKPDQAQEKPKKSQEKPEKSQGKHRLWSTETVLKPFTQGKPQENPKKPRTPGLRLYSCFACNFSSDEVDEMRAHLVTPAHGRKAKQVEQQEDEEEEAPGGYLHCDTCMFNTSTKKQFIKHLEGPRHRTEAEPAVPQPLDESRYGRKRKVNPAMKRKSVLYDTPEQDDGGEETPPVAKIVKKRKKTGAKEKQKITNAGAKSSVGNQEVVQSKPHKANNSLRRVVLDPAKVLHPAASSQPSAPKATKSAEEILQKISSNPKTVKQRQQNVDAMNEYNEDHEDDLFADRLAVKSKGSLFKSSARTLLPDSDTEGEQDVTLCSAKTPVTGGFLRFLRC
jgi:hypothetical protein